MNIIRKALCLALALAFALLLASCGKVPAEEATTATQQQTAVNRIGETQTVPGSDETTVVAIEKDITIVYSSYNKYGDNYAAVKNIKIDTERFSAFINGTLDCEIIRIGSRSSDMRIGLKAYDKNGNLVRDTYVQAELKGARVGKAVTGIPFDVPLSTAKVVFEDYTEQ